MATKFLWNSLILDNEGGFKPLDSLTYCLSVCLSALLGLINDNFESVFVNYRKQNPQLTK